MWTKTLTAPASDLGATSIVLRLTVIILLLRPMGPWWIAPFILSLAGLALILPRVLNAPATWYALSLLVAARIVDDWPLSDNHIYLLAYWCLAIGLALKSQDPNSVLRRSSKLLIGLAFLFAVIWRVVLSPDYLDGRFFQITFLTDPRFENAAILIGGLSSVEIAEAREFLQPLPEGAELVETPMLPTSLRFRAFVYVSTWGTVLIETLCSIAFLFPFYRSAVFPHIVLLSFCVVTYALAPVAGFGWLLLTMGLAGVEDKNRFVRAAYISAWFLILLYDAIPWAELLVDWFGLE